MLKVLFWNVQGKNLGKLIACIAHERQTDVVILAEPPDEIAAMLDSLNNGPRIYNYHETPNARVLIFSTLPVQSVGLIRDYGTISIRRLRPPAGMELILVAAHLSSKLFLDLAEQGHLATRLREYIQLAEESCGHSRTVIVGDLNMNPFEAGLVSSEALHATMTRRIAKVGQRRVLGQSRPYFYNPMWKHFGNGESGPAGTYFKSPAGLIGHHWNIFDQVLLRPAMLPYFDDEVEIISSVSDFSLLTKSGRPNSSTASDHLPIAFALYPERTEESE
jgi:hypothetical protein